MIVFSVTAAILAAVLAIYVYFTERLTRQLDREPIAAAVPLQRIVEPARDEYPTMRLRIPEVDR